jgi:hypothetical protein
MTKYVIAALVAVAAFLGLLAWGQQGHSAAREARQNAKAIATQLEVTQGALRLSTEAAALNRKLSESRLAVAEKQRKANEALRKELDRALKDNPDWAASPVPDSVWDALGPGTADRAESAPSRTPR